MRANKRFFVLGLCALMLLSGVSAANLFAADETAIIGTVYADDWDEDNNVIAAFIVSLGEEYVIVKNAIGKELFKLDNKVVKAFGVIGEGSEGTKTITVTKYEVMPE